MTSKHHGIALDVIKQYYLREHVLVQSRNMDISNDCALDEYLIGLLKQGKNQVTEQKVGNYATVWTLIVLWSFFILLIRANETDTINQ